MRTMGEPAETNNRFVSRLLIIWFAYPFFGGLLGIGGAFFLPELGIAIKLLPEALFRDGSLAASFFAYIVIGLVAGTMLATFHTGLLFWKTFRK